MKTPNILRCRERLLGWYDVHHRALPWHGESDPYRVFVSEVMLVQTTIATVTPRYAVFLERFPTVRALAEATEDEVLKAWEGLGYYRRARLLHQAARVIVDRHRGIFPQTLEQILELPGVGRYMAGAIASFAFGLRAPILEANTRRVLARLLGMKSVSPADKTERVLWEWADRLVCEHRPGDFNQAFMELGQRLCSPTKPRCGDCPWASDCAAFACRTPEAFGAPAERKQVETGEEIGLVVVCGNEILMRRRPPGTLWHGMWEWPCWNMSGANPGGRPKAQIEKDGALVELGEEVRIRQLKPARSITYTVTRFRIRQGLCRVEVDARAKKAISLEGEWGWFSLEKAEKLSLPSPIRKAFRMMAQR
jgi:A/G-specific adenine glycosylase